MKVSVITVCYNATGTIPATLRSALAQKDVEFEYIVVDGASPDGTADLIRAFADGPAKAREAAGGFSFRWISEKDRGMYDALNKGIALATGDVVGILNADDTFEDDRTLAAIAAAFDDATDAVYSDIRFVRDGRTTRYYSAAPWRPWMVRWGYMMPHPGVYIRRRFFAELGPYRTDYRISADFELMLRYFRRHNLRRKYLPRSTVKMTPGGMSTCGLKAMLVLNRENVRANRDNGYFSCLPMMLPKYFYKILGVIFPPRTAR